MADRIHPAMDAMQPSLRRPPLDALIVRAGCEQLSARDAPMLAARDRGDSVSYLSHTDQ
ncbi:MAG: hypothetical protein QOE11_624 [Solirubrobacteraceae bacterium]|nr:hypothetical protein [Solirubrobacteraceae bacterium]